MQTDTLFQIIDRHAVATLKVYHYTEAKNTEAAALAQQIADDLAVAGDVYVWECLRGKRVPGVQPHLRFHDHGKAEGWRAGKDALEEPTWDSLMQFTGELALTHAKYWTTQGRIQWLKGQIRGTSENTVEQAHFEKEFVKEQRAIDLLNQRRNMLVQAGDQLFARLLDKSVK